MRIEHRVLQLHTCDLLSKILNVLFRSDMIVAAEKWLKGNDKYYLEEKCNCNDEGEMTKGPSTN